MRRLTVLTWEETMEEVNDKKWAEYCERVPTTRLEDVVVPDGGCRLQWLCWTYVVQGD